MPGLKKVYGSYKGQGLVLIGVHSDPSVKDRDKVVKQQGLPYPICEETFRAQVGVTGAEYKIDGFPTVVVIGKNGKIAAVDPKDLGAEVKQELRK